MRKLSTLISGMMLVCVLSSSLFADSDTNTTWLSEEQYLALTPQQQLDYLADYSRHSNFQAKGEAFGFGMAMGDYAEYVPGLIKLLDDPEFEMVAYDYLKRLTVDIPKEIEGTVTGDSFFEPDDEVILTYKKFMTTGYETAKEAVDKFENDYRQLSPQEVVQKLKRSVGDNPSEDQFRCFEVVGMIFENQKVQYKAIIIELTKEPVLSAAAKDILEYDDTLDDEVLYDFNDR